MPIKQTNPKRARARPMVYFQGTSRELKKTTPMQLLNAFKKSGTTLAKTDENSTATAKAASVLKIIKKSAEKATNRRRVREIVTSDGNVFVQIKRINGKILITPLPVVHGISGRNKTGYMESSPYRDLISILSKGFNAPSRPWKWAPYNVETPKEVSRKKSLLHGGAYALPERNTKRTIEDRYSLEFMAPIKLPKGLPYLRKAKASQIVCVHINLSGPEEAREKKMKFYKRQIQKRFGVPVKFFWY